MINKKAFTLIELIITIAIIAILAAMVAVSMEAAQEQARQARGLQFSDSLKKGFSSDLIADWSFDNTTNPGRDDSGKQNNGIIYTGGTTVCNYSSGSPASGCPSFLMGKIRNALQFSGDDHLECTNTNTLNTINDVITIEAWIKADNYTSTSSDTAIIVKGSLTYGITRDERSGSNNRIWTYLNGGTNNLPVNISLGNWQHIAFSYNRNLSSNQWKIYVNGKLENQRTFNQAIAPSGNLFIGRNSTQYFRGAIDEVRVYKAALTAKQIQKLYAEGLIRHLAEN